MTSRMMSASSKATKSDDCRPLLVSTITEEKADLATASSLRRASGSILAASSSSIGRGRICTPVGCFATARRSRASSTRSIRCVASRIVKSGSRSSATSAEPKSRSKSTSSTGSSGRLASVTARLTAIVVQPTPPTVPATAMIPGPRSARGGPSSDGRSRRSRIWASSPASGGRTRNSRAPALIAESTRLLSGFELAGSTGMRGSSAAACLRTRSAASRSWSRLMTTSSDVELPRSPTPP